VAAFSKILILVCGKFWRVSQVLLYAALTWCLCGLLSQALIPGIKNIWSQAGKLFFLLNPLSLYLNTQMSKEVPVLAGLILLLFAINTHPSSSRKILAKSFAFGIGLIVFLWIRGQAQMAAFLSLLLPILFASGFRSFFKGARLREVCLSGVFGVILASTLFWCLRQNQPIEEFEILYENVPLEQIPKQNWSHLDPDPFLWLRQEAKATVCNIHLPDHPRPVFFKFEGSYDVVGLDDAKANSPTEKFVWNFTPRIPSLIDEQAARLTLLRLGFLNTPGLTRFDRPLPKSLAEFLWQVPQAILDGMFLPVFGFLKSANAGQSQAGLLCLPALVLTAGMILLFVADIFRRGASLPAVFFSTLAFSGWGLFLYGYVIMNLGALLRLRHPFWVLFVSALFMGLAHLHHRGNAPLATNRW